MPRNGSARGSLPQCALLRRYVTSSAPFDHLALPPATNRNAASDRPTTEHGKAHSTFANLNQRMLMTPNVTRISGWLERRHEVTPLASPLDALVRRHTSCPTQPAVDVGTKYAIHTRLPT